MKIAKIGFPTLSVEAVLDLANQCSELLLTRHPDDPKLSDPLTNLEKPRQTAELALANSRRSELSEKIEAADVKRDRLFIGLSKCVETSQFKEWDRTAQGAAVSVITIIERHGKSMHLESMSKQSALMMALFEDLDTEQTRADLEKLNAGEWLSRLKESQEEFSALMQHRDYLDSQKDIPGKKDTKPDLVKALSILLSSLDFLIATQFLKYGETGTLMNQAIEQIVESQR